MMKTSMSTQPAAPASGMPDGLLAAATVLLGAIVLLASVARRRRSVAKPPAASLLWQPSRLTGFLPLRTPQPHAGLARAEALLEALPELIDSGAIRAACEALPELDLHSLLSECTPLEAELVAERAALVYAFLGYAYLRGGRAVTRLPRTLAVPWHAAASFAGRAPSLDYVVTVLANVSSGSKPYPVDAAAAAASAASAATFTGLADERYFYELHALIELAAAPAVGAMVGVCPVDQDGPVVVTPATLTQALEEVARGVRDMAALLPDMTLGCRPLVFHETIRGSLANFEERITFEGVSTHPFKLGGASGAQSAVLPCVDAFLGIGHSGRHEMPEWSVDKGSLAHLPPPHRALLAKLRSTAPASAATVERLLTQLAADGPEAQAQACALRAAHAACLDALTAFRKAHFGLVRQYIVRPAAKQSGSNRLETPSATTVERPDTPDGISAAFPALTGTGGSELGGFLSGRLLDTARAGVAEDANSPPHIGFRRRLFANKNVEFEAPRLEPIE